MCSKVKCMAAIKDWPKNLTRPENLNEAPSSPCLQSLKLAPHCWDPSRKMTKDVLSIYGCITAHPLPCSVTGYVTISWTDSTGQLIHK